MPSNKNNYIPNGIIINCQACISGYCGGACGLNCLDQECAAEIDVCTYGCINYLQGSYCNQVCYTGWFGNSCQYKCHCQYDMCDGDGRCINGSRCAKGWFGPLCQYQDLCSLNATVTPYDDRLTDADETTCVTTRTVHVTWPLDYQVNWLQIYLQDDLVSGLTFTFKINGTYSRADCTRTRYQGASNLTVYDVRCDVNAPASEVLLALNTTVSVCSVYISGGRNVALRQSAVQFSMWQNFHALYAIDGNVSPKLYVDGCSHSMNEPNNTWNVTFNSLKAVNRYVIRNRDENQERLVGFVLRSFDANNQLVFSYTDTNPSNHLVYTITTPWLYQIKMVSVMTRSTLSLCEVEVYGDGTTGYEILDDCSSNCLRQACDPVSRACTYGCVEGFTGIYCNNECKPGWFGTNCEFMCHCQNGTCSTDGSCLPGVRCSVGWFGPLCQYQNLLQQTGTTSQGHDVISDGDDATCDQVQNVTVTWTISYHITWMQIYFNDRNMTEDVLKLTTLKNGTLSSADVYCRQVFSDTNTIDVYCSLNTTVDGLTLNFTRPTNVCTVNVSGGRNVALKQQTSQFSMWRFYNSYYAVDGNSNARIYIDGCAHSMNEAHNTWNVTFKTPKMVNRYIIYNRDEYQERLRGFVLRSFGAGDQLLYSYTDTNPDNQLVYTITTPLIGPVHHVSIMTLYTLTICEVEVFGDCLDGSSAVDCQQSCSQNCLGHLCNPVSGQCLYGCTEGYLGQACDKACNQTYFGQACSQTCSPDCLNQSCQPVNGQCWACPYGQIGTYCNITAPLARLASDCPSGEHVIDSYIRSGTEATCVCLLDGTSVPGVTVQWFDGNTSLGVGGTTASVTIHQSTDVQQSYNCRVMYDHRVVHSDVWFYPKFSRGPVTRHFTVNGDTSVVLSPGMDATFFCRVDADPPATAVVVGSGLVNFTQADTGGAELNFTLTGVRCLHTGRYTCTGRNKFTTNSTENLFVDVNVRCAPGERQPPPDKASHSYQTSTHENTTFIFEIYGYPDPSEFGLRVENGSSVDQQNYHVTYSKLVPPFGLVTLQIDDVNTTTTVTYILTIKNSAGQMDFRFTVIKLKASVAEEGISTPDDNQTSLIAGLSAGCGGLVVMATIAVAVTMALRRRGRQKGDNTPTINEGERHGPLPPVPPPSVYSEPNVYNDLYTDQIYTEDMLTYPNTYGRRNTTYSLTPSLDTYMDPDLNYQYKDDYIGPVETSLDYKLENQMPLY